jgi:DNA-binding IclR family transcriptional regulator
MTAEVANRLGQPVQTVLRSLQDVAAQGLVQQPSRPSHRSLSTSTTSTRTARYGTGELGVRLST